jgi:hypothetical protein
LAESKTEKETRERVFAEQNPKVSLSAEATKFEAESAAGADAVRARRKKGFLEEGLEVTPSDHSEEELHPASKEKPEHRNRSLDRVVVNETDGLGKPNERYAENKPAHGELKPEEAYAENKPVALPFGVSDAEARRRAVDEAKEAAADELTEKPAESLAEEKPDEDEHLAAPAGVPLEDEAEQKKEVKKGSQEKEVKKGHRWGKSR